MRGKLDEVVCRHSTAKRVDEIATVGGTEVLQTFEPLTDCVGGSEQM